MTLSVRIIPCLDVTDGRVVKGVNFTNLVDAGDPVEMAQLYGAEAQMNLPFSIFRQVVQGAKLL
jgi:cyclase